VLDPVSMNCSISLKATMSAKRSSVSFLLMPRIAAFR